MERWRRLIIAGSIGAVLLCVGLLLAPALYRLGSLALARSRWARRGGSAYTMVVSQLCTCYETGIFQLTVRNGKVIGVEALGGSAMTVIAPAPAHFSHLTVEAGFERAASDLRENWWPNLRHRYIVRYDPEMGYITLYESGDPAVPQFYLAYTARDLRLLPP